MPHGEEAEIQQRHNQAYLHLFHTGDSLLEDSLRLSLLVRNTDYLAGVCAYLAEAALWEWKYDAASRWLAQSLVYQGPTKYITINELQRLFIALRLAAAQGDYRQAAALGGLVETAHAQLHYIHAGPMLPLVDAALAEYVPH